MALSLQTREMWTQRQRHRGRQPCDGSDVPVNQGRPKIADKTRGGKKGFSPPLGLLWREQSCGQVHLLVPAAVRERISGVFSHSAVGAWFGQPRRDCWWEVFLRGDPEADSGSNWRLEQPPLLPGWDAIVLLRLTEARSKPLSHAFSSSLLIYLFIAPWPMSVSQGPPFREKHGVPNPSIPELTLAGGWGAERREFKKQQGAWKLGGKHSHSFIFIVLSLRASISFPYECGPKING